MVHSETPARVVGEDPQLLQVLDLAREVADTDATVLLTGDTGTGKDLLATLIHQWSSRCKEPLVPVNCAAIPDTLVESELFGSTRGAFSGAHSQRAGKFESADGGTIFLDEISELNFTAQAKLLRILQSGECTPLGSSQHRYLDIRVVAATNRDLRSLVEDGKFRNDLYYRLNVVQIRLPALSERRGDIPLLVEHFMKVFAGMYEKPGIRLSETAEAVLLQHDFPGNVRELENALHRAVVLCKGRVIGSRHLPPEISAKEVTVTSTTSLTFHDAKARVVEDFERSYLIAVLQQCGGIISRAALAARLSERVFHSKLRKYGIDGKRFRGDTEL